MTDARIERVVVVHVPEGQSGHFEGVQGISGRRGRGRRGATLSMNHGGWRSRAGTTQLLVQEFYVLDHAGLEFRGCESWDWS